MARTPEAYVVDASVAVKWYLSGEVLGSAATRLYTSHLTWEHALFAPAHIHCEVPSAIIAATRGASARLSVDEGRKTVNEFLTLDIRTIPTSDLVLGAYDLVHEYEVSIYDALYLTVSLDYQIPLITADAKFYRQVSSRSDVLWLGDFEAT